jgi:GNAT superfamily N-acetyltransferase
LKDELEKPPTMSNIAIRPLSSVDKDQISSFVTEHWGANVVVVHDVIYRPSDLPGFIAFRTDTETNWLGLVTYRIHDYQCEIITIDSVFPAIGIGTTLLEAVKHVAIEVGCRRLWLITTNDNLDALRFYQRRGLALVAVYRNAVNRSRELKPEIPEVGAYGIPLRDEIELEMVLSC